MIYVFANLGRNVPLAVRRQALEKIRDTVPTGAVIQFAEIDEGDTGDEHALVREVFGDAYRIPGHTAGWTTRVPTLIPEWADLKWARVVAASPGVPHWSPARVWVLARITKNTKRYTRTLGGHLPAGAMNGKRPARVKPLLVAAWWLGRRKHKSLVAKAVKDGDNLVWGADTNSGTYAPTHKREVSIFEDRPDRIRAVPAKGYRVRINSVYRIDLPVERTHGALVADFDFVAE